MKKILILLICLLLTGCSCKPEQPDENKQYTFKTTEEIRQIFKTFSFTITLEGSETKSTIYNVMCNESFMYYSNGLNDYLVDSVNNITYKINLNASTKFIPKTTEVNKKSIEEFYLSYLTAHHNINKGNFDKLEGTTKVNNIDAQVYEDIDNYQNKMITTEKYFVELTNGVCIKRSLSVKVGETTTNTEWEISNLSFDSSVIDTTLNNYINFEDVNEEIQYNSWPDTPLANLIPKFNNGTFEIATDNSVECYIMIKGAILRDVQIYVEQLKNYQFVDYKSFTNDYLQHFYVTYNEDDILLSIKYSENSLLLTITIKKSTKAEIEAELAKLQ